MNANDVKKELGKLAHPDKAKTSAWFFKTGKGQYGYGDKFLGITVPEQRKVAKQFGSLELNEIKKLLESKIHEHRFTALEILVAKYEVAGEEEKAKIYKFYLQNTKSINNWDLVDTSARYIAGDYLLNKPKNILYKLVKSENLWERRVAIVCTHEFISHGKLEDTFRIASLLMKDDHDLIHKATGWMLREAGKKDEQALKKFLKGTYKTMPRTMLRYAIEKFPASIRKKYLKGEI
jgi:3-methyladenine DNA glycosylase AlkD